MGRPKLKVCSRGHDIEIVGRYEYADAYGPCKACASIHSHAWNEKLRAARPPKAPTKFLRACGREGNPLRGCYCEKCVVRRKQNNAWQSDMRKRKPDHVKRSNLKHQFGITLEQWRAMVEAQGNRCAVCNQEEVTETKRGRISLAVDHNHETGKVRALLCHICNRALGMLKEDVNRIRRLADYVEAHSP